jgi:hypothetical protein
MLGVRPRCSCISARLPLLLCSCGCEWACNGSGCSEALCAVVVRLAVQGLLLGAWYHSTA